MIEVHDDRRILRFEGEEIGFSTSERPGAGRWIEFTLYKTAGDGQYVLSRVGVSNVYHEPECRLAVRGRLEAVPRSALEPDAVPCDRVPGVADGCSPGRSGLPLVCPEPDKTWARAYRTVEALFAGLMKHDQQGGLYMTAVARRLLEDASGRDREIAGLYQVETIT